MMSETRLGTNGDKPEQAPAEPRPVDTAKDRRPSNDHFDQLAEISERILGADGEGLELAGKDSGWFKTPSRPTWTQTDRNCLYPPAIDLSNVGPTTGSTEDEEWSVRGMAVRSYAAIPLFSAESQRMGTFWIVSSEPRRFSHDDLDFLTILRDEVMDKVDISTNGAGNGQKRATTQKPQADMDSPPRAEEINDRIPGVVFEIERTSYEGYSFNYCSQGLKTVTGIRTESAEKPFEDLVERIHEADIDGFLKSLHQSAETSSSWRHEFRIVRSDGTINWLSVEAELTPVDGSPQRWSGTMRDVTEQKQREEQLRESIEDKDTLIREIHHRAKNNLQVITSLLKLQKRSIGDERLAEIVSVSEQRIRSMHLIHEKLYETDNLNELAMDEYVPELVDHITTLNGDDHPPVNLDYDIEPIALELDQAVPCGLMINELVSNSFAHAFDGDSESPEVGVVLQSRPNGYFLSIRDNGSGLPGSIDLSETESMGLKLVNKLARNQLNGTLRTIRDNGTTFEVEFPA